MISFERSISSLISLQRAFNRKLVSYLIFAALPFAATPGRTHNVTSKIEAKPFAHCGGFLEGGAFDATGNLWVVDVLGDRIIAIDPQGQCVVKGSTGGHPNGARFSPDGRLYVTDIDRGVIAIDTKTMTETVVVDSFEGQPIRTANDLAFDKEGGFYFTVPTGSGVLSRSGRLFYQPPVGHGSLRLVSSQIAFPNGVTVSHDGETVLVGQFADKSIISLPAIGSKAMFKTEYLLVRTRGGIGPDGLAMDSDGSLYWANFGDGSVGSLDASGRERQILRLPATAGHFTTNLAVRGDKIYVLEAQKGEVWRLPLTVDKDTKSQ